MVGSKLPGKILSNLLEFVSLPVTSSADFMNDVLKFLSTNFGFERLAFFLVENQLKLNYTKTINVSSKSHKLYEEYFHRFDVFNPQNAKHCLEKHDVIKISDVMPMKQYEKTEYYNDYLKNYDYYYILSSFFKSSCHVLGGYSLIRSKKEGNFTAQEVNILEQINPYISNRMLDYMELSQIKSEHELFNSSIKDAPYGIVILNSRHSIVSYNKMAQELFDNILNDNNNVAEPVRKGVEQILYTIPIQERNTINTIKLKQRPYDVKIVPSLVFNAQMKVDKYFLLYINKVDVKDEEENQLLTSTYNLTDREIEIVELMACGLSNNEIASKLIISNNTVRTHIENIRVKVDAKNRLTVLKKLGKIN